MNNKTLETAINHFMTGLSVLKEAVTDKETTEPAEETVGLKLLAEKLANSYTTIHPEYKVASQFKYLCDKIKDKSKIGYVISELNEKYSKELGTFFDLDIDKKQELMLAAVTKYEAEIKDILTKRFAQ